MLNERLQTEDYSCYPFKVIFCIVVYRHSKYIDKDYLQVQSVYMY